MNNTQMAAKKSWTKPQLLVLVRNMPEEAVLTICKLLNSGSSPNDTVFSCIDSGCTAYCVNTFGS